MNLFLLTAILVAAAALSVLAFWLVHLRAGRGGPFLVDSARGAAVFGTVGTAFAVVLAFVTLIGLEELNTATDGAETEAVATLEIFRDAELLPQPQRALIEGAMVCYARAVTRDEWALMARDERSPAVEHWVGVLRDAGGQLPVASLKQQSVFAELLADGDRRTQGRRERLSAMHSFVPNAVWYVLVLTGALTIGGVMLFRHRDEPFAIQAALVAGVTVIVVAGLAMVLFLANPYGDDPGSLQPLEMRITLSLMPADDDAAPCDARGLPA